MSKHLRKYEPGPRICSIGLLWEAVKSGQYVMVNGKPTHPGWVASWRFNVAAGFVSSGMVSHALVTDAWHKKDPPLDFEFEEVVF